jgi:hypothetical protein
MLPMELRIHILRFIPIVKLYMGVPPPLGTLRMFNCAVFMQICSHYRAIRTPHAECSQAPLSADRTTCKYMGEVFVESDERLYWIYTEPSPNFVRYGIVLNRHGEHSHDQ